MRTNHPAQHAARFSSLQTSTTKFFATAIVVISATVLPALANSNNAGLLQWSFTHHNATVPVAIWYPTEISAKVINAGPFTLFAASNAPLTETQHPLLILSHGTGGSGLAHHPIAETLATAGFMVAALTHPGDNYQDRSLVADERYFDERPRQLAALLHAITRDEKLGALIDHERVGAIGHSAGGYAVAVLAGATANRQALIDHCNQVDDDPSCHYRDPTMAVTSPTGESFTLPKQTTHFNSYKTPAIRSIALLAPLGSAIDKTSQIDQNTAVKVITAELDNILPHQYHSSRLQQVAKHGAFREAKGAGHFSFIAPIAEPWQQPLGEVAEDPAGFDREAFNETLGLELTEWFSTTLTPEAD